MDSNNTINWEKANPPFIRIKFTPTILEAETPTQVNECFVEIHPDHIRYFVDYISETLVNPEDPKLGSKEGRHYFDTVIRREFVQTVEFSMGESGGGVQWIVFFDTTSTNFKIYFYEEDFKKAREMFDQILDWYLFKRVLSIHRIENPSAGYVFDEIAHSRFGEMENVLRPFRKIGSVNSDSQGNGE